MGNKLPENLRTGTLGELIVQLRLLEYGIQAAPPIKDSGNDLVAIKGYITKFIQVKTLRSNFTRNQKLPEIFHIVALVELKFLGDGSLSLDKTKIFVYEKGETIKNKRELTKEVADLIWRK